MRVAITGGAGFIGCHLASALVERGAEVVLIDNLAVQIHGDPACVRPDLDRLLVRRDVRDLSRHPDLIDGVDTIFHFAAETGTAQSMYEVRRHVDVNVMGTVALLEAIAKCGRRAKRLILASSRAVYGEGAYRRLCDGRIVQPNPRTSEHLRAGRFEPVDEDGTALVAIATPETLLPNPGSVYAATKMAQEMIVNTAAASLGVTTTILRLQNVYGEGQSLQNPYTGIIAIFYNRARQGLGVDVYEDGRESRDFVYVGDVVRALLLALEGTPRHGRVYNVGTGLATSLLELARLLMQKAGFAIPIRVSGQYRLGDIRHGFADVTLIERELGFHPQVSLADGLAWFCDWAAEQATFTDTLEAATQELRKRGLAS